MKPSGPSSSSTERALWAQDAESGAESIEALSRFGRRRFLLGAAGVAGLAASAAWTASRLVSPASSRAALGPAGPLFPGALLGPSMKAGHMLRGGVAFPEPSEIEETDVAIVGGGIAGLAAGWRLSKRGADFRLLELESETGGNARAGARDGFAYPWGAHYVPALSDESVEAIELLQDLGAIKGRDAAGVPIYDEYMLCQAPHERLFLHGRWHDGLLPRDGAPQDELRQMREFLEAMAAFSAARGRDGKPAFAIPVDRSSRDAEFTDLDRETMLGWMSARGWTSARLRWYVDYCCRDDFGTPAERISAWAGIHYFAARRGRASGEASGQVLTWPEGNAWIARRTSALFADRIRSGQLVHAVEDVGDGVEIRSVDPETGRARLTRARAAILACPRFVAARIARGGHGVGAPALPADLSYAPWMVANVRMRGLPQSRPGEAPLSWDNVFYGTRSIGYVVATHQLPRLRVERTTLTCYMPLDHLEPKAAREEATRTSLAVWQERVVADLERAHPGVAASIEGIDVWLWGHAMARPTPGFVWGEGRAAMAKPYGRIRFAHSDMSGLSIFEEACYHGARAADEVMRHV